MIENKLKADCILCKNKSECDFKDICKSRVQNELKTLDGWRKADVNFDKYIEIGDKIDEKLYNYFLDMLPPISLKGGQGVYSGFQVSEAVTDAFDNNDKPRALYDTFVIIDGDYYYLGLNFRGEIKSKYKLVEYVAFRP